MNFTNLNVHNVESIIVAEAERGERDDGSAYWCRDIIILQDGAELTLRLFSDEPIQVIRS